MKLLLLVDAVSPASATTWIQSVIEHLFVGPVWPASVVASIVLALVLVSLLGVFSLDHSGGVPELDVDPGVDLEMNPDVSASAEQGGDVFGGFAAATMKAVHLDRVPLMIWLTVFSLFFWVLSFVLWFEFDVHRYPPTFFVSAMLTIRNGVMAIILTRFMTTPLHRLLIPPTHHHEQTLIGGTAVVETSVVNETFGRARYTTNAAPLLIDIRTSGEPIVKGSRVLILRYDAADKVYHVAAEPIADRRSDF